MKLLLTIIGICLLTISGVILYQNNQSSIDPDFIYGDWVELQTLSDRHEVLTLSKHGVLRNHRLVTTHFEFDGSGVSFSTGDGHFYYQWNESYDSPILTRREPEKPTQTLIKHGYEHTVPNN